MTDTESCSKPRPLRDISQFLRRTGTQQQRTANQLQEALPWCIVGDVIPVRQEDGLVQILIPDLDLGLKKNSGFDCFSSDSNFPQIDLGQF